MKDPAPTRRIVLLGATGSIGQSTLEVIRANRERIELVGIAGNSKVGELAAIAKEFEVRHVAVCDAASAQQAREDNGFPPGTRLYAGPEGLVEVATLDEADTVLVAIVGTAGLEPTLAAIEAGKRIALASKEILVMAGELVMAEAHRHKVDILPVDSEHNAIFQCLEGRPPEHLDRVILTASGGPFREYSAEAMAQITPKDALNHPNWSMGPKITVDSGTMANKGLEMIEARWLFDVTPERIEVVVHPQSIVHSMVRLVDGSVIAQLSPPDMTYAIQHALLYPDRGPAMRQGLDLSSGLKLDFEAPDEDRFPCLRLAREALQNGGGAPACYNAANEVAVEAFLEKRISYLAISRVIEHTLQNCPQADFKERGDYLAVDAVARRIAESCLTTYAD